MTHIARPTSINVTPQSFVSVHFSCRKSIAMNIPIGRPICLNAWMNDTFDTKFMATSTRIYVKDEHIPAQTTLRACCLIVGMMSALHDGVRSPTVPPMMFWQMTRVE